MASENCYQLRPSVPLATAAVVGLAILVAVIPRAASWLVFDRRAILEGEVWRLLTCHWVHFSISHLVYDSLALGIAGWLIESQQPRQFRHLLLFAPITIGVVVLLFQKELAYYGGLSGLAFGAIVLLLLSNNSRNPSWGYIRIVVGVLLVVKIGTEAVSRTTLVAQFAGTDVIPAVSSHIAGAATAVTLKLWQRPRTIRRVN